MRGRKGDKHSLTPLHWIQAGIVMRPVNLECPYHSISERVSGVAWQLNKH